ncbi:MAG: LuxR C-terminal-related transcriptional regulator [Nitrospira sp.]
MERPWRPSLPASEKCCSSLQKERGTKEVATLLNIAVKTVEFHKFRIMDQLNLHSTLALAKQAIADGLISSSPPPLSQAAARIVVALG